MLDVANTWKISTCIALLFICVTNLEPNVGIDKRTWRIAQYAIKATEALFVLGHIKLSTRVVLPPEPKGICQPCQPYTRIVLTAKQENPTNSKLPVSEMYNILHLATTPME